MKDDIKSELVISGFTGSPEEITARIGLQPTKVIKRGDVKRSDPSGVSPPVLHEENAWIMQAEIAQGVSFDEHLEQVLEKLRSHSKEVAQISAMYECELSIYGFAKDADRIAIHIDKKQISELARLDISLDVDIYPTAD